MNKMLWNNWIKSIAINIIILIVILLITDMSYETNDDYAISLRIKAGYPYIGFINYFFCLMLIPVQNMFTGVNVFVASQILFSFLGFVFILKIMLDSSKSSLVAALAVFVIAVFSFDHYAVVQFTKTAALLLVAGMLIMMDSILKKRKVLYYVFSIVFLFLGVSYRPDSLICAIGFVGIYLLFWLYSNRKSLIQKEYLKPKRVVLYILLLTLIISSWGYFQISESINKTGEEREYYEYSDLRSQIVDYPVYEYYEENRRDYEKIGISENDLYLIDKWYLDYDGAASADNLRAIISVDDSSDKAHYTVVMAIKDFAKDIIRNIKKHSFTGIHLMLLMLLAICMFAVLKPRHWLYILAVGAFAVCIYLAVYYMQRPVYRALYVADIGAATWLLYYMCNNVETRETGNTAKLIITVSIVSALLLCFPVMNCCNERYAQMQCKVMSVELENYLTSNKDIFFVFSASEKKYPSTFANPMKLTSDEVDNNSISAGSWGTMSSYLFNKMAEHGISNPIKDLINNDSAYYIGNMNIDRLTEYYDKWYGNQNSRIVLRKINSVAGMAVWKVEREAL